MREILFRGKRIDNKAWEDGSLVITRGGCYDQQVFISDKMTGYHTPVIPETVCQFTGLYDKNGMKIFEGDIIRYADEYEYNCYLESLEHPEEYDGVDFNDMWTVDEVVYCVNYGYPAFDLNKHDFEINGLSALDDSRQFYFEVIGNIYDNPELLEVKQNG